MIVPVYSPLFVPFASAVNATSLWPSTNPFDVYPLTVCSEPLYFFVSLFPVNVTFLGVITTVASSVNVYSVSPTLTVILTLTLYVPTSVNDGAVSLQLSPSATVLIPSSLEDVVTSWYLMDSTEINSLAWSTYTGSKPVPSLSV